MEFTTIISAPDAPLLDTLTSIHEALRRSNFKNDGSLLRAEFDATSGRGVFDEVTPNHELRIGGDFAAFPPQIASWQGASTEYWNDDFLLYVLVGRLDGFVNVWVDVRLGSLTTLLERSAEGAFLASLATICEAVHASGAYGHGELDFAPLSPDRSRTAFVDMPEYPGCNSNLGIIPASSLTAAQAESYASVFPVRYLSVSGYWVLTEDLRRRYAPWTLAPGTPET